MGNALQVARSPITPGVTFSLEDETYGIDVMQELPSHEEWSDLTTM